MHVTWFSHLPDAAATRRPWRACGNNLRERNGGAARCAAQAVVTLQFAVEQDDSTAFRRQRDLDAFAKPRIVIDKRKKIALKER